MYGRSTQGMSMTNHLHMDRTNILVVEDDADLNEIMCTYLKRCGYSVHPAYSGSEAAQCITAGTPFHLVLCDLMLPGLPGDAIISMCKKYHIPSIVVSAKSDIQDKVSLLNLGANDYITKPFDLDELGARVHVQVRQSHAVSLASHKIMYGAWCLDTEARTLHVNGAPVRLTKIEYDICKMFAEHPHRVYTKPEIFHHVWGEMFTDDDNTVNVHISQLRTKLKPTGTDTYIKTVWGVGFKFCPEENADHKAQRL